MYLKYLWYVIRHKWFVLKECFKVGLYWRGITHDLSKLRPSEFIPYARYFYSFFGVGWSQEKYGGCGDEIARHQEISMAFDRAWLYHIHRNPHHWQFWLLQEDDGSLKKIPMPVKYLKEMLTDWRGAGRAITGKDNTPEWYLENKDKIKLGKIQHRWLELKLGIKPIIHQRGGDAL